MESSHQGGFSGSASTGDLGASSYLILRLHKMCNLEMNFTYCGRPRVGSSYTEVRTRFRIQKFRIPFSSNNFDCLSQKLVLARPKDTFSLAGGFNNAWLK